MYNYVCANCIQYYVKMSLLSNLSVGSAPAAAAQVTTEKPSEDKKEAKKEEKVEEEEEEDDLGFSLFG
ncbi:hypothetical protein PFFCH_03322 [Plasmodium falciparum FCH/4]|uniref:60S acidic ribosomal protein P1 n=1 Tax=Plasmodium falciparum FCH/4 TaxID=1036724 RepID=A0A024VN04_PLAFA|nr:hypothetical protein PFFCH_03322 [Plasmodium falciparum FCH/4]